MSNKNKKDGVVFTPKVIADFMCTFIENKQQKILEPACGNGIFIQTINNSNLNCTIHVYANDINIEFIKTCKEIYNDNISQNIFIKYSNIDFLDYSTIEKYNTIITNPPYIRIQDLNKEIIQKMKKEYPILSGSFDIYLYFILKCIDLLMDDGKLICIIPNSFLYTKSCMKIKKHIEKYIEYIIDFKELKVFPNINVYTCIIVINKAKKNSSIYNYKVIKNIKELSEPIVYEIKTFDQLQFNSLLNFINIKNGIATLCDHVFILSEYTTDEKYIYFCKNNKNYMVETDIVKKILKVSKNKEYYIIFPYDDNGNIKENLSPKCKEYLLDFKNELQNRDRGKKIYEKWYAFGRKQSIKTYNTNRLFISSLVKNIKDSIIETNIPLFYSGLYIELKENSPFTLETIKNYLILNENEILNKSNVKSNGWYSLNKESFNIKY